MKRPDRDTLACVNPAYHWFRLTGQGNLTVHKVYGQDHLRLLRCRMCGEEFSERRGTALCNPKRTEDQAASIIHHVDAVRGARHRSPRACLQRHGCTLAPEGRTLSGSMTNKNRVGREALLR